MSMMFRRSRRGDYAEILDLQSANYIAHLSEEERRGGFLSAQFTREQTAAIAEDLGITVAIIDRRVAGFLCAFRNDFNHGSPVVAKMIESYDGMHFEGRPLGLYRSYIYGPVCIDRAHRRKGLLRGLYETQKKDLAGQFEIGVAFVSRQNPHSLGAHVAGLGMAEAGDFELNGHSYVVLAFPLR